MDFARACHFNFNFPSAAVTMQVIGRLRTGAWYAPSFPACVARLYNIEDLWYHQLRSEKNKPKTKLLFIPTTRRAEVFQDPFTKHLFHICGTKTNHH